MMFRRDSPVSPTPSIIPNPDPSSLTGLKIEHDIAALERSMQARIDGIKATFEARLAAMDKASELFDANLNRIPTSVDRQVGQLKELHDERFAAVNDTFQQRYDLYNEKFASIQVQFVERDTRVEQTARDTKVAVDAALQAAEKAVGKQNESFALSIAKSETATVKQIDQQGTTLQTSASALAGQIADIKERTTRLESQAIGGAFADAQHNAKVINQNGYSSVTVGVVAIVVAVFSIVASSIVSFVLHATPLVK